MKFLLALITLFFFSTQIIPVKYLGYMYSKASVVADDCNDNDEDETETSEKNKEKFEKDVKIFTNNFPSLTPNSTTSLKYYWYNIAIKKQHSKNVLTPPPLI